jgi:hypothetical protein
LWKVGCYWRRGRDSNPRYRFKPVQLLSRQPRSATPAPLQGWAYKNTRVLDTYQLEKHVQSVVDGKDLSAWRLPNYRRKAAQGAPFIARILLQNPWKWFLATPLLDVPSSEYHTRWGTTDCTITGCSRCNCAIEWGRKSSRGEVFRHSRWQGQGGDEELDHSAGREQKPKRSDTSLCESQYVSAFPRKEAGRAACAITRPGDPLLLPCNRLPTTEVKSASSWLERFFD